jgi:predicted amidophosphoribosyltransferase
LLPPIPSRLLQIDETTVGEHFSLAATDTCYYIWEYAARQPFNFSPTNQLVKNLKIKPTEIAASPARRKYKQEAVAHCANALRALIPQGWVENHATIVPLPGSKANGHPDFDNRLQAILRQAFAGYNADVRPIVTQTESRPADHEHADRLRPSELRAITQIDEALALRAAPRPVIAVLDDVLNSGKHFKVAQDLLSDRFRDARIIGIFIARCVRIER